MSPPNKNVELNTSRKHAVIMLRRERTTMKPDGPHVTNTENPVYEIIISMVTLTDTITHTQARVDLK
jgi:hypothetical protein